MRTSLNDIELNMWLHTMSEVQKGGCRIWSGYKISDGYGRLSYKGRLVLAHRLKMFLEDEMTKEEFNNPKCVVMHVCDNPACIEITHLRKGTQQDNIKDRKTKKRSARHLNNRDALGRFKRK